MRRLLIAAVAAAVALSPVAFYGAASGVHVAHADLAWCPECDAVMHPGNGAPPPSGQIPPVTYGNPYHR